MRKPKTALERQKWKRRQSNVIISVKRGTYWRRCGKQHGEGKRTGREIRKKEKKKEEKKCRGLLCGNDTENGSDDGDSIKKSRRREGGEKLGIKAL